MTKGWAFPDLPKLERALAMRGWSREEFCRRANISHSACTRLLAGEPVSVETSERVAAALLAHEPTTSLAAFLSEDVA